MLEAIASQQAVQDVPGIAYKDDRGRVITNPDPTPPCCLDDYPSPYLDGTLNLRPRTTVCVTSSRGCPFDCTFCVTPAQFNRSIRHHSIDRVIEDLTCLKARGITSLFFADALFFSSHERSKSLMRTIRDSGLQCRIWCEGRPEILDDELLELMRDAGVTEIAFGMESMNPETMAAIKKKHDIEEFTAQIRRAQEYGIHVHLLHIYGLPGDSCDTMLQNIDYVTSTVGFTGKSRGQWLKLWFGAEAEAQPGQFGLTLSDKALANGNPAYLSAHDQVRNVATAEEDQLTRSKVVARVKQEYYDSIPAEVDQHLAAIDLPSTSLSVAGKRSLLPIARLTHFVATRWLNPFETFKWSWQQQDHSHALLLIDSQTREETSDKLRQLQGLRDTVSFRSQLGIIERGSSSLLCEDALQMLEDHLWRDSRCFTSLYCNVTPDDWASHYQQLVDACTRLTRDRRDKLQPSSPSRPSVSLAVLLDATTASTFPQATLDEMRQQLEGIGVEVMALYRFEDEAAVTKFREKMVALPGDSARDEAFVGFSGSTTFEALSELYGKGDDSVNLPPMILANGVNLLLPGIGRNRMETEELVAKISAFAIAGRSWRSIDAQSTTLPGPINHQPGLTL